MSSSRSMLLLAFTLISVPREGFATCSLFASWLADFSAEFMDIRTHTCDLIIFSAVEISMRSHEPTEAYHHASSRSINNNHVTCGFSLGGQSNEHGMIKNQFKTKLRTLSWSLFNTVPIACCGLSRTFLRDVFSYSVFISDSLAGDCVSMSDYLNSVFGKGRGSTAFGWYHIHSRIDLRGKSLYTYNLVLDYLRGPLWHVRLRKNRV